MIGFDLNFKSIKFFQVLSTLMSESVDVLYKTNAHTWLYTSEKGTNRGDFSK